MGHLERGTELERDGRRITLLRQQADSKDWVVREADVPSERVISESELAASWREVE
jgi:hypothetical protein